MKKTKILLGLFLLFLFGKIHAQNFDLGKVTIEELQEKVHPKDTAAVAAVIFEKQDYDAFPSTYLGVNIKQKIKIYKKEGYSWANWDFGFPPSAIRSVVISEAYTYNLVEGKIVKTKLMEDGIFLDKVTNYYWRKKVTMPNIKEGSIIEFQYRYGYNEALNPHNWVFQKSIPINLFQCKTTFPDIFVLNRKISGFNLPIINTRTVNNSFVENTYTFFNLPALKNEAYVNNIQNYLTGISTEIKEISNSTYSGAVSWDAVTKQIYGFNEFGSELEKKNYFENDVEIAIKGLASRDEKISAVFNLLKSKVSWNKYYGYSCNLGVKNAYKTGKGNVADINLMLTAMLRYAEIDAYPILLSTRSNGIPTFPSLNAYNYVISGVKTSSGMILLDATEKYSLPDVLPFRDLNWVGRLIHKDKSSQSVELNPKVQSTETVFLNGILKADNTISGKLRRQLTKGEALKFREDNIAKTDESYLDELENTNYIQITDYKRENQDVLDKPLSETYSFVDEVGLETIEDKIYLLPLLFFTTKENPFKLDQREYPVDYGYPIQKKYSINLEIPSGYNVLTLPESLKISTENGMSIFKYTTAVINNNIQIVVNLDINVAIIDSDLYVDVKEFYQKMIDKQNEKIVLIKTQP